jgi:hypothetical protein
MQGGFGVPKSCKVSGSSLGARQHARSVGATALARLAGNPPYERRSHPAANALLGALDALALPQLSDKRLSQPFRARPQRLLCQIYAQMRNRGYEPSDAWEVSRIITRFLEDSGGTVCLDTIDIEGLERVICARVKTIWGVNYYHIGELGPVVPA